MKTATLALLALLLASPAKADNEMTAGDLYSLCTSADENDLTSCRFYVFGVVQGVILASTMTANRKFPLQVRSRMRFAIALAALLL
jgi:hypothetical protein